MRRLASCAADERAGETHSDDYYRRAATEEYLADLAEDGLYNAEKHSNMVTKAWQYIKEAFIDMLRKAGFNMELSDDELRYVLWKSHNNLREGVEKVAKDAVLKDRAGIKDYVEDGEPVKSVAEGYEPTARSTEQRTENGEFFRDPWRTVDDINRELRELYRRIGAEGYDAVRDDIVRLRAERDAILNGGTRNEEGGMGAAAESGGAGGAVPPSGGEPPVEPPTPTPEPQPESLPPTGYDRPRTAIEQAQAVAMKVVSDTKASLEECNSARRELDDSLKSLHKAMRLQKEYDKEQARQW